ncbi:MAG: hypothetical protein ACLFS3_03375 [Candidatus Aenigmatarchaeota archaeon]
MVDIEELGDESQVIYDTKLAIYGAQQMRDREKFVLGRKELYALAHYLERESENLFQATHFKERPGSKMKEMNMRDSISASEFFGKIDSEVPTREKTEDLDYQVPPDYCYYSLTEEGLKEMEEIIDQYEKPSLDKLNEALEELEEDRSEFIRWEKRKLHGEAIDFFDSISDY